MTAERAGRLQPVAGRLRETCKEVWRERKREGEREEREKGVRKACDGWRVWTWALAFAWVLV